MHVCMHACVRVCMYVCNMCVYAYMCTCVCVCMYVYTDKIKPPADLRQYRDQRLLLQQDERFLVFLVNIQVNPQFHTEHPHT